MMKCMGVLIHGSFLRRRISDSAKDAWYFGCRRRTSPSSRPPDSVAVINLPKDLVECHSRAAAEVRRWAAIVKDG